MKLLQKKKFSFARFIKIVILLYCTTGILIYYLQDYVLFQPVPLTKNHLYNFSAPHREVNIAFTEKSNISIVQFLCKDAAVKGVVLYFHGNKKNISWYARFAPRFTKHGYEVWMIDYPGYGKSTGSFTEEMLYLYAMQMYKLAKNKFAADSIIIYGKSMGTGIAACLASFQPCKKLILETPYYSFSSIGSYYFPIYPMEMMTKIKIPSFKYLQNVKAPVSIFHGTGDRIIPYSNAERLKPYLKPGDEFITVEGGSHNDLNEFPLVQQKLDSLLTY
ncbi:MAG: alpha/beta fold hydrolase [Chitinophagaceae bacterium]|nr:alpha/beta fold hydrolase [Chitinophagaceae bacterium]